VGKKIRNTPRELAKKSATLQESWQKNATFQETGLHKRQLLVNQLADPEQGNIVDGTMKHFVFFVDGQYHL
jgi:hypothetical protein